MEELVRRNVLLVDDDDISNFLNRVAVLSTGIAGTISIARNGEEALRFFTHLDAARGLPDLVLLDINMPVMNGFEFLLAFRELDFPGKENILIIVVSSSRNPEDIRRARSLGIGHYLAKPISEETIKAIVLQKVPV